MTPAPPQPPAAAACTIVSPNYLPFARTLAQSYRAQHPTDRFFVLVVASATDPTPFLSPDFETVLVCDLPLEDLRREAMKFDLLELNTNVKPTFLKLLFARHPHLETLTYLDPDIFVYSPLTPVFEALQAGAAAVLTPHITTPITDAKLPSEQDHLYNGTYNLGFIALRRSPETDAILNWWERRCLDLGFSEGRTGLFVDQKWMNLAPGLFPNVRILRHPGCNMAYWNLHERRLTGDPARTLTGTQTLDVRHPERSEGPPHFAPAPLESQLPTSPPPTVNNTHPLVFFHFSGITPEDPASLSKHTDRYALADRPDLQHLFAAYKSALRANRNPAAEAIPYGFDQLSDGTAVTRLARRIYAARVAEATGTTQASLAAGTPAHTASSPVPADPFGPRDPFDAHGPFAQYARRHRLIAGKRAPAKSTWREFYPTDRRVEAVHRLLKLALRVLGPNRYELLMRYLAHVAVLRNQSTFLGKD